MLTFFDFPPEIILHILSFCDEIILNKLESVFKQNTIGISFLPSLFEEKEKRRYSVRNYWISMYYDYFKRRGVKQINEILDSPANNHFVVINNLSGVWVSKNDLYHNYLMKTTQLESMRAIGVPLEKVIRMLMKQYNSMKFSIVKRDCIDDTAVIFIERMFESHVFNCLCRNIHEWCSGYYCDGCDNCNMFYPSHACQNINKREVRVWNDN